MVHATGAVFRNVMVPMRDGVRLCTDVHLPADGVSLRAGRFPAILIRTSVGKAQPEWAPVIDFFPQRGYAVVIQDIRSRMGSEGNGEYYHTCNPWEGDDGYDAIEWIAAQPWSDGNVGMMGSSHRAIVQTQAALHRPPHLRAICPEQGPTNIYAHEAREGGAMALHMYTAIYNHALDAQELRDNPAAMRRLLDGMVHMREWLLRTPWQPGKVPLSVAPHLEKTLFNYYLRGEYDEWWAQECNDQTPYWDRHADVPCFITGGWFDPFVAASAGYFDAMWRRNRRKPRLLIGPWAHGGMRANRSYLGEVDFGPDSVWGYPKHSELRLRWFDRWLKGEENGADRDSPVEIFVMGGGSGRKNSAGRLDHGGRWRREQEWPLARTRWTPAYLHPGGVLSAAQPRAESASSTFTFDPARPVPTAGGSIASLFEIVPPRDGVLPDIPPYSERGNVYGPYMRLIGPWGPVDQKEKDGMLLVEAPFRRLSERPDILVFQSAPLAADTELTGPITVNLWVSSSAPDTDFTAKLIDVYPPSDDYPDGFDMNLLDSVIRCRYRDSWTRPELMRPGEVYPVKIELPPTSNLFKAGHRIRLDISSSNFPKLDINPNTGEPMGRHTRTDIASNTVHFDRAHPSHVVLPVIAGQIG